MTGWLSRDRRGLTLALLATLALLIAHGVAYKFLCDDAFISFRYAHNLATGHGLVFNPGFERVEGYTNFLWVVVLAAFDAVGVKPEHVAPVLSFLLTVGLWGLVARAAWRLIPAGPWRPAVLLPTAWLAVTRSVAVWSTSGLETRLFEVLVVAGVFRLIDDLAAVATEKPRRRPVAALWFALAALTRPDGMLVAAAVMTSAAVVLAMRRRLRVADVVAHGLVFGGIVGAHVLFRHTYYGEWVPNTYFAKVAGRSWWGMGSAYLACFTLEYAAWLWVPFLVAGAQGFVRDRRIEAPLLIGAAVLPHALYVASIGGDHFEFRPLDMYFPLLFLLMARGAAALADGVLSRFGVAFYAAIVTVGLVAIPWQSHRQFPKEYSGGFPGRGVGSGHESFLNPAHDPVYRWPGVRLLAEAHRKLLRKMTDRLVGVRQEEHALFLATVIPEGRRLGAMVRDGVLPQDAHLALSAVGAIPYYSGLRVLDRLGLTDAVVAKSAPGEVRMMAHDRHATLEYAASRGVDLWAENQQYLLSRIDGDIAFALERARASGADVYCADAGHGDYIVARLPQGLAHTAPRFPKLTFRPVSDDSAYEAILDEVITTRQRELAANPSAREARVALACALSARGREDEALPIFRALADENVVDGWYNLGAIFARRGALDAAVDAYRKALAIDPSIGPARHNLGLALARSGNLPEAIVELREAMRLEPDSEMAIYTLGAALLMAGDSTGAAGCRRRLQGLGTIQGAVWARRLEEAGAVDPGR